MNIRDLVAEHNPEALLATGFEDAFIGIAERSGQPTLAVYDAERCIEILMRRDGIDYEEASDAFSYGTLSAWLGEHTPLFLWRRDDSGSAT